MKVLIVSIAIFTVVSPTVARQSDALIYAQRGRFPVGTREFTVEDTERPLNVTIWYPALNPERVPETTTYVASLLVQLEGEAIRNAQPATNFGPFPLVIFSHGSGGFRFQSLYLTEHLASYGFVVMAADHPGNTLFDQLQRDGFLRNLAPSYIYRPQDVLREIGFAETLTAAGGELEGLVDVNRIAVMGHSFGGYTALAAAGARLNFDALSHWCDDQTAEVGINPDAFIYTVCFLRDDAENLAELRGFSAVPSGTWPPTTDPRIQAVIALAPWNGPIFGEGGLDGVTIPAMVIVGSEDTVTPPERDAYAVYDALPGRPKMLVTLDGADHFVFAIECPEFLSRTEFTRMCSDPVWDMEEAHDYINYFSTAFLLSVFYGDAGAQMALMPGGVMFEGITYSAELE
jgi:predicted dienelactone hydrolase